MLRVFSSLFYIGVFLLYFDFMPSRFVTVSNSELPIALHSKIKDTNYYQVLKIRPIVQNALVTVFSNETQSWVSSYALWTQMPNFDQNLKIRPVFSGNHFSLTFEVLDTKTGKIYKTPQKKVWGVVKSKDLLSKLVTKTTQE